MSSGNRLMSAETKEKICSLWKKSDSFSEVGRQVDKHPGSVFTVLKTTGGIQPIKTVQKEHSVFISVKKFQEDWHQTYLS